ncbi:K(+) efflux antiporter 2, chloroplastic-like [Andrographis paniculata]|uniref:K(+) efflux antiporter 2, chloroplastic-like n=1 Tax=Andrographis paniculata TaxID=175694 RepID=UPI0021E84966|nr:K(+) efflux antiporter 2, chloroplastic-like [Andrographis paniculata]XP_051132604.1 K(+) efflux antiporter 2, chloroplastic-like [Andrographis paniculata]XP_051132605.1 K(+) efflux antiporter 2, chloroplastic-like [Andrographis paniculata]
MDVACSLSPASAIHGGEFGACRASECLNLTPNLKYRGFCSDMLRDSRFVLRAHLPKKLKKKNTYYCNATTPRALSERKLWCHGFNDPSFCNTKVIFKIPRHVGAHCLGNEYVAQVNEHGGDLEVIEKDDGGSSSEGISREEEGGSQTPGAEELRELLQKALKELDVARSNSEAFEEKAQKISETAIALKDEATNAWDSVNDALKNIQEVVSEEAIAKEGVEKAAMALSLAEERLQVALDSMKIAKENNGSPVAAKERDSEDESGREESSEEEALLAAQQDINHCQDHLANCKAELKKVQSRKDELQKEVDRLNQIAEKAQLNASKAEEEVANVMLLAERAVASELGAAQRVADAELALQRAEKNLALSIVNTVDSSVEVTGAREILEGSSADDDVERDLVVPPEDAKVVEALPASQLEGQGSPDVSDNDNGASTVNSSKDIEDEVEKLKAIQSKVQEMQREPTREGSTLGAPKLLLKKSSRFFSASFFSFAADEEEFTPASFFRGLVESARKQLPKLVFGSLLVGAGIFFYVNRGEKISQLLQQPEVISTSMDDVSTASKPLIRNIRKLPQKIKNLMEKLPHQEINEEEASLFDMLWLLLASVVFVPIFQKIPGGSPVLGYLAAGILIGPYGLSIIRNVHATKAIAEFGVVFLLFNIGLELSVERLSSMKKYVFGLGTTQVLVTAVAVGLVARYVSGQLGPAAIVIGNGLALSSTAVVLQVLQERGESTSRHGRATFSVLLFQDLAVVVLLILIPLISPSSSKGGVGFQAIAEALGLAAVKAVIAISAIIAGGRLLLRPIYKQIAENQNAEIFSANTLLVILGTSLLTARAGLSMALGAFLAGLLLAETEFSLQVESDIAPYRGLLLGLFFMTVGMSIDPKLLVSNFKAITGTLGLLIVGKTMLVAIIGKLFGLSLVSAVRVGLLLAPGGEFAFVAFGEAVNQGIMSPHLSSLLFLVVGISMALTPWLAAGGQFIASHFELHDVRSLLPVESETDDLQDHIIICGFGRVGQIIAQLLSERLIPFVALDVRSDRVAMGRALDLPVYFGDAGSREVLHKVGAERACAAAVTLDSPGANYRTVWALSKYFPNIKTFVRAHDVDHGLNLEKAGATAVVPETLEPSLQLAAAVLAQAKLAAPEIAATINDFRSRHLSELRELSETSGSSLGYGFSQVMNKPKSQPSDTSDDSLTEGTVPA